MDEPRATILLVEWDGSTRSRIGSWLEDAGFDVFQCPGPLGPDYVCVAGEGRPCPLASAADAVVLDSILQGDEHLLGTSSFELLLHYWSQGKPVVVLSAEAEKSLLAQADPDIVVVAKPPNRHALVGALDMVLESKRTPPWPALS